jgi:hypothetical protein
MRAPGATQVSHQDECPGGVQRPCAIERVAPSIRRPSGEEYGAGSLAAASRSAPFLSRSMPSLIEAEHLVRVRGHAVRLLDARAARHSGARTRASSRAPRPRERARRDVLSSVAARNGSIAPTPTVPAFSTTSATRSPSRSAVTSACSSASAARRRRRRPESVRGFQLRAQRGGPRQRR